MLQKKMKLSFKVCCYLQSRKVWSSIIQNHGMFEKSCHFDGIVGRPNISKNLFKKYFLLILVVAFLVPNQCSFPKFQLYVTKKYEMIFAALCFYLHLLKNSDFVSQTGNSNIFVLHGVIYIQHFQTKSSFSSDENTRGGIRDTLL